MKIAQIAIMSIAAAAAAASAEDSQAQGDRGSLAFLNCQDSSDRCTSPNRDGDCSLSCLNRMDVREGRDGQIFVQARGNSPSSCPPCNTVSGSGYIHDVFKTNRFGTRRVVGKSAVVDFGLRRETCEKTYPGSGINAENNCIADPDCEFDYRRNRCVAARGARSPPERRLELEITTAGIRSGIRGVRAVGVQAIFSNRQGREVGTSDKYLFEVTDGTVLGRTVVSTPSPTRERLCADIDHASECQADRRCEWNNRQGYCEPWHRSPTPSPTRPNPRPSFGDCSKALNDVAGTGLGNQAKACQAATGANGENCVIKVVNPSQKNFICIDKPRFFDPCSQAYSKGMCQNRSGFVGCTWNDRIGCTKQRRFLEIDEESA